MVSFSEIYNNSASTKGLLLTSLSKFYSHVPNFMKVLPYLNGTSQISLRLIDWFVTNYCKRNPVLIPKDDGNTVNLYLSYRAQLKAYSKQQFDPFRRHDRITFNYSQDDTIETTVGQLNFFRWMLMYGVLTYLENNVETIEKDMATMHTIKSNTTTLPKEAVEKKVQAITKMTQRKGVHTITF